MILRLQYFDYRRRIHLSSTLAHCIQRRSSESRKRCPDDCHQRSGFPLPVPRLESSSLEYESREKCSSRHNSLQGHRNLRHLHRWNRLAMPRSDRFKFLVRRIDSSTYRLRSRALLGTLGVRWIRSSQLRRTRNEGRSPPCHDQLVTRSHNRAVLAHEHCLLYRSTFRCRTYSSLRTYRSVADIHSKPTRQLRHQRSDSTLDERSQVLLELSSSP